MNCGIYRWMLLGLLACWGPSQVVADEPAAPPANQAAYDNAAALQTRLEKIAQSDFAALSSLGKTLGERDVWLLTLGEGAKDPKLAAAKPAILLVGSVQASDLAAGEISLQMAEKLLAHAASKEEPLRKQAEQLLERYTFYVIPRPSPDASERCFAELKTDSMVNGRPTDDDRDGETDEDPTNDLDANGMITMMRVESSSGTWILHPEDPRVMIEADPKKNELASISFIPKGSTTTAMAAGTKTGRAESISTAISRSSIRILSPAPGRTRFPSQKRAQSLISLSTIRTLRWSTRSGRTTTSTIRGSRTATLMARNTKLRSSRPMPHIKTNWSRRSSKRSI